MDNLGVYLIVVAIILFVLGRRSVKKNIVKATNGSVSVGGSNNGQINITKNESPNNESHFLKILNIIAALCTILGTALLIWPIK